MRLNIRKRARLYTIAASLAIMVAASQPAFAYVPGNIMNENSLLCLQPVPNAFQGPGGAGVQIAQEPCDDSTSTMDPQQWRAEIVGISGGQYMYYVKNQSDNKCLDVTNANTSDRAAIQQYYCNGGSSEKWFIYQYAFGGVQYVNYRTSKCLDVPYATTSPGYIWQYHCTSSNIAQSFTRAPLP